MKQIIFAILVFSTILNGCKEASETPTTNANDFIGTYVGSIISTTKYTPTSRGVFEESSGSTIKSVNISKDSTNIYLDGRKMKGGPELFTLELQYEKYLLSISSKTIEYSISSNKKVFKAQPPMSTLIYEFIENRSGAGILRKS